MRWPEQQPPRTMRPQVLLRVEGGTIARQYETLVVKRFPIEPRRVTRQVQPINGARPRDDVTAARRNDGVEHVATWRVVVGCAVADGKVIFGAYMGH